MILEHCSVNCPGMLDCVQMGDVEQMAIDVTEADRVGAAIPDSTYKRGVRLAETCRLFDSLLDLREQLAGTPTYEDQGQEVIPTTIS